MIGTLCVSFSRTASGLSVYHLLVGSNFSNHTNFPVDHLAHSVAFGLVRFSCYYHYFYFYHYNFNLLRVFPLLECQKVSFSRTRLSILTNLNNAVVWMVFTRPFIFKTSHPCFKRTNYNWYHRHFHVPLLVFFCFTFSILSKDPGIYLFLQFYPMPSRNSKVHYSTGSLFFFLFFFFWLSPGLVVWLRLDDSFLSQDPREVCASHFPGRILGCAHTICSNGQI